MLRFRSLDSTMIPRESGFQDADDGGGAVSDQNPYAVERDLYAESPAVDGRVQDAPMLELIQLLRQTRPWVRLFSLLMLITAALMFFGGLLMVGLDRDEMASAGGGYVLMAILYVYPAICLGGYASGIRAVELSGDMKDVVEAIRQQKQFWRYCGLVTAVLLILSAFVVVLLTAVSLFVF